MDEILLLPAAIFFLVIGLYNLYKAHKKKESYIPVFVSLLMIISLLVMYFYPPLGVLCFFLSVLLAGYKWPAIKQYQQKRILDSFNKNDYSKELKIKELFIGNKLWGKLALKYGAKKAALIYSLYIGIALFLALYFIRTMDTPIKPGMSFILSFSATYLFVSYYHMHGYFKKFLAMKEINLKK
ncbi:hypothetical protein RE476_12520 [Methanolobus mangrovi]|uniref:Uncharacterized protein n=1 Tax=Methanolobus mangrovi TaxID=3072977 RepID=A0AA51UFE1_9EURY|nr:hypothetical protein [Methanolobus mangrovi]WMW22176.1 hypothetical protein RE476_12520 [Methanolobus mangrovi]